MHVTEFLFECFFCMLVFLLKDFFELLSAKIFRILNANSKVEFTSNHYFLT